MLRSTPQWYGAEHHCPELLDEFVYGLPELFRADLHGAELIAATGLQRRHGHLRSGATARRRVDRR